MESTFKMQSLFLSWITRNTEKNLSFLTPKNKLYEPLYPHLFRLLHPAGTPRPEIPQTHCRLQHHDARTTEKS